MENFNKNWLVILLIVLVFTSIGFLFGHMAATHHQKHFRGMHENMMYFNHGCGDEFDMPYDDNDCMSKENIEIKGCMEKCGGGTSKNDTCKKVIIKKVIK